MEAMEKIVKLQRQSSSMNTQEEAGETVSQNGRRFAPSQQARNAAVNAVKLESLKSLEVRENTGSIGRTFVGRIS